MKYLIRLDDACPTMHRHNWDRMEAILERYKISPMVGIIPHNEDEKQQIDSEDPDFWNKVIDWENKGWAIALHGYDHCYISSNPGINPLWNRSEFAGVPLEQQKEKIKKGVAIFRSHGINPKYFFAPSHTFDNNTLEALRQCSDIRIISDTIATKPYKSKGFIFLPQLGGSCKEMIIPGIWTFCFHPSVMTDKDFSNLENFLSSHQDMFISFDVIKYESIKGKNILSRLLSWVYFSQRSLRKSIAKIQK